MDNDRRIIASGRDLSQRSHLNIQDRNQQRQAATAIIKREIDAIYEGTHNSIDPKFDHQSNPVINQPDVKNIISSINKSDNQTQDLSNHKAESNQLTNIEAKAGVVHNHNTTISQNTNNNKTSTSVYDEQYYVKDARTMNQNVDWTKYHKAWQDYYKKYYEYYYQANIQHHNEQIKQHISKIEEEKNESQKHISYLQKQLNSVRDSGGFNPQDEALNDLRARLRKKVQESAQKARKSHHFWPVVSAISVIMIFLFLQYNRIMFAAIKVYAAPSSADPQTIIVDPSATTGVGDQSRLIIPKINVNIPVTYDIPNDEKSTNQAMENGAAHFAMPGANSHPGETGNTVISAHSSSDIFSKGNYKFAFTQLPSVKVGDTLYADYKNVRYSYVVTKIKEVMPTDIQELVYSGDKPMMTLVTCVPIGSDTRRLLVFAEQVTPDPKEAKSPKDSSLNVNIKAVKELPKQDKTIFEKLFNL